MVISRAEAASIRPDLEREMIGSMIGCLSTGRHKPIAEVATWFEHEYFSDALFSGVYQAMLDVFQGDQVCSDRVIARAIVDGHYYHLGGQDLAYIGRLINDYYGLSAHYEYFANEVYEDWRRRALSGEAADIANSLKSQGDVTADLARLSEIASKYAPDSRDRSKSNRDVLMGMLDDLERPEEETNKDSAFFGVSSIDDVTGGLEPGSLTTVAARPSCGKTALMLHLVANESFVRGNRCLVFSCEMTNKEIFDRWGKWISQENRPSHSDLVAAYSQISNSPIELFCGTRTIGQIEHEAKAYCQQEDVHLIVIDYLQILRHENPRNRNKAELIEDMTNRLKQLAMEIGRPIVVGSQVNRDGAEQVPKLHQMRGSGAIEQDSNYVFILHPSRNEGIKIETALYVAKARNSAKSAIPLEWYTPQSRYEPTQEY